MPDLNFRGRRGSGHPRPRFVGELLARSRNSTLSAIACASMPHLPIRQKWRCLSEGALCAGLSNRASTVMIILRHGLYKGHKIFSAALFWAYQGNALTPNGLKSKGCYRYRFTHGLAAAAAFVPFRLQPCEKLARRRRNAGMAAVAHTWRHSAVTIAPGTNRGVAAVEGQSGPATGTGGACSRPPGRASHCGSGERSGGWGWG